MIACVAGVVRGDAAFDLRIGDPLGQRAERLRHGIARVRGQPVPVDRAPIQPRRRAGLQPPQRQLEPRQRLCQTRSRAPPLPARPGCCCSPIWITPRRKVPVVRTAAPHRISAAVGAQHAGQPSVAPISRSSTDAGPHRQPGRLRQQPLHRSPIQRPIGLRARPAHCRPLAAVQQLEMDARRVGRPAHQPVQRIHLAHQVALADAADRRDCRTSRRSSRAGGSAAASAPRCAPPPRRPRSRHARRPPPPHRNAQPSIVHLVT